jgi:hypothetical protein
VRAVDDASAVSAVAHVRSDAVGGQLGHAGADALKDVIICCLERTYILSQSQGGLGTGSFAAY